MIMQKQIQIIKNNIKLNGLLDFDEKSIGLVIFAHGSGSSRLSPRNQLVSTILNKRKIATLLFDLLTEEEEKMDLLTSEYRFNIDLLSDRLILVTTWILKQKEFKNFKLGYFGASTGAAAALIADAKQKNVIKAIVSRGGRVDLAKDYLQDVKAPTLLIVGELDQEVIKLNDLALEDLRCKKKLSIVKGATHLFEEKNKLDEVAYLASEWFLEHFNA
jgi:putative phosphoribosyl transferase